MYYIGGLMDPHRLGTGSGLVSFIPGKGKTVIRVTFAD